MSIEHRFWDKVKKTDTCWLWIGVTHNGYGKFSPSSKTNVGAHCFAWLLLVGPIPKGKVLDHLYRVRNCVRPEHLRVVTNRENIMDTRSESLCKKHADRTHCRNGHPFNGDNLIVRSDGSRRCRACQRAWWAVTDEKRKQRKLALIKGKR